jgi:hypothetical protein
MPSRGKEGMLDATQVWGEAFMAWGNGMFICIREPE